MKTARAIRHVLLTAGLALGLALAGGCHRNQGKVLGKAPGAEIKNILAVRAGETKPDVTLRGRMVEKCPVAGCWFYLQDETGTIKVDTKAAGFVVVDVPLQTVITVSGKVQHGDEEPVIEATGARF